MDITRQFFVICPIMSKALDIGHTNSHTIGLIFYKMCLYYQSGMTNSRKCAIEFFMAQKTGHKMCPIH